MTQERIDGRRVRGDESRRLILAQAIDTASVEGLDGLTIGRLADAVGYSKSGVATLFGSKEQLQLATIAAARDVFVEQVIAPAREHPLGLDRLCALIVGWLEYSRDRVFSGGCFFVTSNVEYDARPGAVRDALAAAGTDWESYLTHCIERAVAHGDLPGLDDPAQLTFEMVSFLESANTRSLLRSSVEPYERAARGIRSRLIALGADPDRLSAISAAAAETGGKSGNLT